MSKDFVIDNSVVMTCLVSRIKQANMLMLFWTALR